MPRVRVDVTAEHIRNGKRFSPECCAVALATKDALAGKESLKVSAGRRYVRISLEGDRRSTKVALPMAGQKLVHAFDAGSSVTPCCLFLQIPDRFLQPEVI